jgi:hypothetical protein
MRDFYLHKYVMSHPYTWSPNYYVGYVKIISFILWVQHKDTKATKEQKHMDE